MSKIEIIDFELTSDKKQTKLYKITNKNGASVTLCDYGATVISLMVPDKFGELRDVVLGYAHIKDYESRATYFGATIGRCCGRIADGTFEMNHKKYQLPVNLKPNHLHGGYEGFSHKMWKAKTTQNGVVFSMKSQDGEEGYPGNMDVKVTYIFDDTNTLSIQYDAVSDKDTICNMTNHCYFNLNGHDGGSVMGENHLMWLNCDSYIPLNNQMIPTGEIRSVVGSSFDFTKKKAISSALSDKNPQVELVHGIDHMFVINRGDEMADCDLALAAQAESKISGISLKCYTTQKGIHIYTANYVYVSPERGKDNCEYKNYPAFCMETQGYPDAVNHKNFPSTILRASDRYHQETKFVFGVQNENE